MRLFSCGAKVVWHLKSAQIADKFRAEGYRVVFSNKACSGAVGEWRHRDRFVENDPQPSSINTIL